MFCHKPSARWVGTTTTTILTVCLVAAARIGGAQVVFNYTGADQSYTVPSGVHLLKVKLWGAQGGDAGGLGAFVSGLLAVTPGDILTVIVGGQGGDALFGPTSPPAIAPGGYGGGGDGNSGGSEGGAGGGRSGLRNGGTELVTAGGGGGSWDLALGGDGGIAAGKDGNPNNWIGAGPSGRGGTQSAGGAGQGAGTAGSAFQGGADSTGGGGGGGGGGYFGGGGGDFGGGGGSSFIDNLSSVDAQGGVRQGDGRLEITAITRGGTVPEPSALALLAGLAVPSAAILRRRK